MPYTDRDAALLAAGVLFTGASTYFFRRKQTLPFKVAYFFAWPTLGSAIILLGQPSPEQMTQRMEKAGLVDDTNIAAARQVTQMQLDKLRQTAQESKLH